MKIKVRFVSSEGLQGTIYRPSQGFVSLQRFSRVGEDNRRPADLNKDAMKFVELLLYRVITCVEIRDLLGKERIIKSTLEVRK